MSLNAEATIEGKPDLQTLSARLAKVEEEDKKSQEFFKEIDSEPMESSEGVESEEPKAPKPTPRFALKIQDRFPTMEEKKRSDEKSLYVGNVDYSTTDEELKTHFEKVGKVVRATIMLNKINLTPKGYAYVEFESAVSIGKAFLELDETVLNGRKIDVRPKRSNLPGFTKNKTSYKKPWHGISMRFAGRISKIPHKKSQYQV
ncbi:hypothetical protein L596_008464 [Steinernema carpocapsae]|uniref:RRM domain-containing protein n=1 Tax=Steinernema carpocapsae TaxID=34508 RepID=A0A4U5PCK4_STECR|nr:hypothetical protein L596_008464 [Steinernema carpocapsae]